MLKERLIFGVLMIILFIGLMLFGGWLDGTISAQMPDKPIKGIILTGLLVIIMIFASVEFSAFLESIKIKTVPVLTSILSAGLATSWFWRQLFNEDPIKFHFLYIVFALAFSV